MKYVSLVFILTLPGCAALRNISTPTTIASNQVRYEQYMDACQKRLDDELSPCPALPAPSVVLTYNINLEAKLNSETIQTAADIIKWVGGTVAPLVVPGLAATAVMQ